MSGYPARLQDEASPATTRVYQNILSIYFLYIMFEWTLWKFIPVSPQGIAILRPLFDALFFITILAKRLTAPAHLELIGRRMLATLGMVTFATLMSTLLYQSKPFLALQSVFVVFRYLVILLIPPSSISGKFKQALFSVFFIQVVIGLIDASGVISIRSALLPSVERWAGVADFNPTAFREGPVGISSTFLNTIDYSLYLIASYLILFWRKTRPWKWLITFIVFFLIIRTESKTSMVVYSVLLLFELRSIFLRWTVFTILVVPLIIVVIANFELIVLFFQNSLEYNRIGFFVYLLPPFFTGNPINVLFGVGIDPYAGLDAIRHYPRVPQMLLDENSLLNLKDVFWVAQLFQWGIVGLASLIAFLLSIPRRLHSPTTWALLAVVLLLGFTNQVLEIKIFSFLLWVGIKYHRSFDQALSPQWR